MFLQVHSNVFPKGFKYSYRIQIQQLGSNELHDIETEQTFESKELAQAAAETAVQQYAVRIRESIDKIAMLLNAIPANNEVH